VLVGEIVIPVDLSPGIHRFMILGVVNGSAWLTRRSVLVTE
jgi:hypothetical protein